MSGPAPVTVRLADPQVLGDLSTYLGRAARLDAGGVTRLVAHSDRLAVYVCALHGGAGPTVLGLRVVPLAGPCEVDLTLPLAEVAAALGPAPAAPAAAPPAAAGQVALVLPGASAVGAPWAGLTPPRQGWVAQGHLGVAAIRDTARAGVDAVVSGAPPGAGAAAVAALRARVWAGPLAPGAESAPAGVALAAEGLGFLAGQEPAALFRCGAWWRLTTGRGHVLARSGLLG